MKKREKMKITFFKNENHFSARTSYCWENAELAEPKIKSNIIRILLIIIGLITLPIYIWFFRNEFSNYIWLFIPIIIALIVLHELCHALFCVITKRKVERICFLSSFRLNEPTAYVMPEFSVWSKIERVLFYLFPIVILSVIPTIIAIFLPIVRLWLILVALINLTSSAFDINDTFKTISLPKGCIIFEGFSLIPTNNQPIIIHKLTLTKDTLTILHEQFVYENKKLSKSDIATETENVKQLKNEFIQQIKTF